MIADPDELLDVELTDKERLVLDRGLGGPAFCTDALAVAMGFAGVRDLFDQTDRLHGAMKAIKPMSRWDWTRMLLATQIAFASDVLGSGAEWPNTAGLDDARTFYVLRRLQHKLVRARVQIGSAPQL